MSFHLRITFQRQSPWVQITCTKRAEQSSPKEATPGGENQAPKDAAESEAQMRRNRRWLAALKRASQELRLSEEVNRLYGYPLSAACKAEAAEDLEAEIERNEAYLMQCENYFLQSVAE